MEYDIKCPYCGKINVIKYNCEEGTNYDYECDHCKREFEIEVEYSPSFSSMPIEYRNCQECGKEARVGEDCKTENTFPHPVKYLHSKKFALCDSCWRKLILADLEKEEKEEKEIAATHKSGVSLL